MIIQLLEEKNIHYGSVLPDLQQALMNDGDVYPANADDHPQLRGYKVYAEVAEKIIRESGSYADWCWLQILSGPILQELTQV